MGLVVGIIIVIAVVALAMFFLPRWQAAAPNEVNSDMNDGASLQVPDQVDINVESVPNDTGQ